jgi:hypothetical protein
LGKPFDRCSLLTFPGVGEARAVFLNLSFLPLLVQPGLRTASLRGRAAVYKWWCGAVVFPVSAASSFLELQHPSGPWVCVWVEGDLASCPGLGLVHLCQAGVRKVGRGAVPMSARHGVIPHRCLWVRIRYNGFAGDSKQGVGQ